MQMRLYFRLCHEQDLKDEEFNQCGLLFDTGKPSKQYVILDRLLTHEIRQNAQNPEIVTKAEWKTFSHQNFSSNLISNSLSIVLSVMNKNLFPHAHVHSIHSVRSVSYWKKARKRAY